MISYNEEKLEAVLGTIPPLAEQAKDAERKVFIVKTHAGYELVNERVGVLNREKAKQIIAQSLTEAETQVDLKEAGCYEDLPLTPVMKAELARWEKIEDFQDCKIVYQFGEEEYLLKADLVCEWMTLDKDGREIYDEAGNILPDDKKIEAFIDALADEYDTVGGTRRFQATRGEIITVKGGTYGNQMDRKAEKEYLKQAFRERRAEVHEPAYLKQGWKQGKDDIGDTYIEVDMTQQMMYYYKGGIKELETPIVTGNTGRRMGTPEGVNFVYSKQKNRVLRGPNYASPVDFWMPVKGNIGIHDASWRSEFGGEIYKTGGSHGCINTPHEAMSRLYDMAEIGTPVVMFY